MKRLVLIAFLWGCAHQHQAQASAEAEVRAAQTATTEEHTQTHAQLDVHETRVEEPTRVTTTVEEFVPVVDARPQLPAGETAAAAPFRTSVAPAGPATGQLVKRTVRVEERGGSRAELDQHAHADSAAEAKGASTAALAVKVVKKAKEDDKTSWGPPWWAWVLGGAGVAVAAGVAWWLHRVRRNLPL